MTAVVRRAGPADEAALAGLRGRWREERHGVAVGADAGFEQRFGEWFGHQLGRGTRAWIAESDGESVGMVLLAVHERMPWPDRDPGAWGYLTNAFVRPEHRDRGVGRLLLDALVTYADAQGLVRVVTNPSPRSVPFYFRAGFSADHPLLVRPAAPSR